jgi:hypothetical protein
MTVRITVKAMLSYGLVVFFCVGGISLSTPTQEEKGENFRREVRVGNHTPLPFESIGVLVIVSNPSDQGLSEFGSWDPFLFSAQATSPINWKQYTPEAEPMILPSLPSTLTLSPGESRVWVRHLDYESGGEHVFKDPGAKLIRAAIGGFHVKPTQLHLTYKELIDRLKSVRIGDEIYSEPVQIMVKSPEGPDRDAYEFLRSSNLHRYFSEHTVWKYRYTQETAQQLETFISRFHGSRYAHLARLGLALMWVQGIEGKKDSERAVSLLQQVARSADETLTAQAHYYLGKAAEEQGNLEDAQTYYSRALSLKRDPYFQHLAEQAKVRIEQRLSMPNR